MRIDAEMGDDASVWIARRIAQEILSGDDDEVRRSTSLAECLQAIRRAREER